MGGNLSRRKTVSSAIFTKELPFGIDELPDASICAKTFYKQRLTIDPATEYSVLFYISSRRKGSFNQSDALCVSSEKTDGSMDTF